jgi:hypothetical protein
LLQQDVAAVLCAQPIVNCAFEEPPGVFNATAGNMASTGFTLNRFLWQFQLAGGFFQRENF